MYIIVHITTLYTEPVIGGGSHMFDASFIKVAKIRKDRGGLADDNEVLINDCCVKRSSLDNVE